MDIGKSFTYMFDDKKWLEKLAIGGLLSIIPIVNFFAFGYALRTLKRLIEGTDPALPEWDDWGQDWFKGLMGSFVGPLIYSLPLLILAIPYAIIAAASRSETGGLCGAAFSCISSLWGLVLAVILPAAMIQYATDWEFSGFFDFSAIFAFIRDNLGNYIIALLMMLVAGIAAGIVGGIACGIGVAFTSFWATLTGAHLLAQVKLETVPATAAGPAVEEVPSEETSEEEPEDEA